MELLKKYLVGSLIFHLSVVILACVVSYFDSRIKKSFIVFGAHSRKPSFVSYKALKAVPFVGSPQCHRTHQRAKAHQRSKLSHHVEKKHHVSGMHKKNHAQPTKKHSVHKRVAHASKKTLTVPEVAPVLHELSDNVKIAHKKTARVKKAKKHAEVPAKEVKVAHNDQIEQQQVEPIKIAQAIEEKLAKEPEKIIEPEKKVSEKSAPCTTCDSTESVLPDDHMPDSECAQNEAFPHDNTTDYAGFNLIGSYEQKDLIIYQRHVQREVDRLWRPPLGVPKGTICTVMFTIGAEGTVENFEILKRSDVVIYDLSIIRVARNFQFDKSLWGKQFKIDFRQ